MGEQELFIIPQKFTNLRFKRYKENEVTMNNALGCFCFENLTDDYLLETREIYKEDERVA